MKNRTKIMISICFLLAAVIVITLVIYKDRGNVKTANSETVSETAVVNPKVPAITEKSGETQNEAESKLDIDVKNDTRDKNSRITDSTYESGTKEHLR